MLRLCAPFTFVRAFVSSDATVAWAPADRDLSIGRCTGVVRVLSEGVRIDSLLSLARISIRAHVCKIVHHKMKPCPCTVPVRMAEQYGRCPCETSESVARALGWAGALMNDGSFEGSTGALIICFNLTSFVRQPCH
ncbi:uncharacterized protein EI90DRAFT_3038272 [Cantharellus anzutake]|uniref:uncharacterized protein n=1 Tax=Cantharellus anzutake TaxID=1750568 RepID=UPI001907F2B6|nr:uncharacterized protein EI90DRAFT_3038272 [Cantharellus anzutake]KAF8339905.1 hypothetical protein EI90DRAFT_3038272 [Cantharellus anzutake]